MNEVKALLGKPTREKVLPAMPIRVIYNGVERKVTREVVDQEYVFHMRVPEVFTLGWDFYPTDAYALRALFEEAKTPDDVFGSLNSAVFFVRGAGTRQNAMIHPRWTR